MLEASDFYRQLALAIRAELPGNTALKVGERLANVFEQADTPETFNRTQWLEIIRNG